MSPIPTSLYQALSKALRTERPAALVTVVASSAPGGPRLGAKLLLLGEEDVVIGSLGGGELDRVVTRDARAALAGGVTLTRHYGPAGEARRDDVEVFIESFAPAAQMVIFGAVDFTAALAAAGKLLGFRVTVCDARPVFATAKRFPEADEVVVEWPDRFLERVGQKLNERDVVCVLTHDAKFDVPAVLACLRTKAGYIGAMGSRRTHEDRRRRLIEAGADPAELDARLMSPIGLDIGARTPAETAVSICGEIIAVRTGVTLSHLRDSNGPIHRR